MFTGIPPLQVRSKETRFAGGGYQMLLEEFALAHPARRDKRLRRDEADLKDLQIPLRQIWTREVPRICSARYQGWTRLAQQLPAGGMNTNVCQPE